MREFKLDVQISTKGGPNVQFSGIIKSDVTDEELLQFQEELTKELEEWLT